ncbi:MAG: tRNA pseudouridine(38-40) synthase TruA [Terracidiphilus sp.]
MDKVTKHTTGENGPAPGSGDGRRNFRLTLAYDGTRFHGWQVQPGLPTIQGELQAALGRVTGESPLPQGSGRTDTGVHALAQEASFQLAAPIPAENLLRALNRTLPGAIRVMAAQVVPYPFHARHSALAKSYEYRIFRGEICPPWVYPFVYCYSKRLNFNDLAGAADVFTGEHDFTSFAAKDPDLAAREEIPEEDEELTATNIRTVFSSAWERQQNDAGELWVYRVRGNGFLHRMVRNLVGAMIDVGRGYTTVERLKEILEERSRSKAGPTAPASGLFLTSVEYGE